MTAPSRNGGEKSAFLDTNALVRLFEFWDACRIANIQLNHVQQWKELDANIKEKLPHATYLKSTDYNNVKLGITLFKNMFMSTDNYLFHTSQFCQAELHHTLIEYWASIRLTQDKIPLGLRGKKHHFLYSKVISTAENQAISEDIDDFFTRLNLDYGVNIVAVDDPATGMNTEYQDILETAKAIWTRVLVATMDAIIIGTAIRADANVFISSDQALRKVLNHINSDTVLRGSLNESIGREATATVPRAQGLKDKLS